MSERPPAKGSGEMLETDAAPRSPYRGLSSFSASDEDAALFFGRDRERELIVANLLASRLTLLYGQSGIGKSSLLCAGVVNRLRRPRADADGRPPPVVVYVSQWRAAAETVLERIGEEALRLTGKRLAPLQPALPFDRALGWWTEQLDAQLLLIFDHFEQYFLHHPAADGRQFDASLATAILRPELRMHCLISLREDSLAALDRFKGELPNLFRNRLRLDGLSEAAALEAIRGPIERYNEQRGPGQPAVSLEPGLAEMVAGELQQAVEGLARRRGLSSAPIDTPAVGAPRPIEPAHLQLVMEALWQSEADAGSSVLRRGTLSALGGCEEIVGSHVEASLAGLPAKQRSVAARSIRFLVTPSGIKVAHTPRDLAEYAEAPPPLVAVMLQSLCDLRLMRPLPPEDGNGEARFEVFHDLLAAPMLEWRAGFEARRLRVRMRWLLAALSAAIAAAIAIAAYGVHTAPLRRLELSSIDARFGIRGAVGADRDIVIVYLDNRTLAALPGHLEPRAHALRPYYAKLIERLLTGDPDVIAADLEFLTPGHDGALRRAIARANGRIVLASKTFDSIGEIPLFGETNKRRIKALLGELDHAKPGYSGLPRDLDGVVRSVRFMARPSGSDERENQLHAFSVEVAKLLRHLSLPSAGSTLIDYRGPPHTFASVSMIDVLSGLVAPALFRHKIVVIGVLASGEHDFLRTPFAGSPMPGAEVQANAISSVRHGPALSGVSEGVADLAIAVLSLTALLVAFAGGWLALGLYAAVAAAYLILAQLLFNAGTYIPLVYPLLALALSAVGTILARLYLSRQGRPPSRQGRPQRARSG
jgi:CHASE2 domain-containing sensor protein